MSEQEPAIDAFPERELWNVASAWASSYGYALKEPLTIMPQLALAADSEHSMTTRLEGWTVMAPATRKASDEPVRVMISLKRLANSVVPEDEPREY